MNEQHAPNWIEASTMLREALEQYRDRNQKKSLAQVTDAVIDYIAEQSDKVLDEKTIRRDLDNKERSKQLHPIPNWRVELYAKWLYAEVGEDRPWLSKWLEQTVYPAPGKLLTELYDKNEQKHKSSGGVKTNVPPLRKHLWGRFLGRQEEIAQLQKWADNQRHPIAVLCGFGGNGKTTIQQKVGEEFLYGIKCSLRWPYQGAVWVSAVDYPRGQPGLYEVLREIAGTFELFDKEINIELIRPDVLKENAEQLLQERRVLVLLDNFETVSKPNQIDILEFFNNLRGSSQTLISTRYRPDWFLEQEQHALYSMAHVLILVNGLSAADAERLIQDFLEAKSFPKSSFDPQEITHLIEVTRNNPKSILAVLGLVEQGMSLPHLLDAITAGEPEVDRIFEVIIDKAWETILTESDKAVLMAKALFSHSVTDHDLGHIAGVSDEQMRDAIKKLAAISFFELERTHHHELRIKTHPLAQDFARRVLRSHPGFESNAEERWWKEYGSNVIQKAGKTAYESITFELDVDVANVIEHLEKHIHKRSSYCLQAAKMFVEHRGLGYSLRDWGRWDEMLRLAELILNFGIEQQEAELIGECALQLICRIQHDRGEFDKADRYIGLVIEQNTKLNNRWLEAMVDFRRGTLYNRRGYFGAAEQFYKKAIQIFQEIGKIYDLIVTYMWLGGVIVNIATKDLEGGIDESGKTNTELFSAKDCLDIAEKLLNQEITDMGSQFELTFIRTWRGTIARIQGELEQARSLLQSCLCKFEDLHSVARLYRELALVEHLSGNKEIAYSYEEKSLNLFRQLGIINTLPPHHCYRVIDRMKREGTW